MKISNTYLQRINRAIEIANIHFKENVGANIYNIKDGVFDVRFFLFETGRDKPAQGLSPSSINNDGRRRLLGDRPCWHWYGHFMDVFVTYNPLASCETNMAYKIKVFMEGDKIQGNWQDWERVGGVYQSQLCYCKIKRPTIPENVNSPKSGAFEIKTEV